MSTLSLEYTTEFNQAVSDVASVETQFFLSHQRYLQLPNLAVANLTDPASISVWVDVYDGPQGKGYVVCGEVVASNITYRRYQNIGPEEYRTTQDWVIVDLLPPSAQ
jgi:hypothetical protein